MKSSIQVTIFVVLLCATLAFSHPVAQRWYSNGRSYSNRGKQPNGLLKQVGTAGVLGGATLTGLGLLTNNNGLTNTGLNLGAAGVGSKLLAHVFGKK
jgi:hypothetical protein